MSRAKIQYTLEEVEKQRILTKKPDYIYAFSGYFIFEQWIRTNRMTRTQASILIVMSYHTHMFWSEFNIWHIHYRVYQEALEELLEYGYVIKIRVPSKKKGWTRECYTLSAMGRDLEKDFEKFYDTKIAELEKREKAKKYKIDRDDYFRLTKIPKSERYKLLPPGVTDLNRNKSQKERIMVRKDVKFEGWAPARYPEGEGQDG